MRYMFNHALSGGELYIGCNERMCDKSSGYFFRQFKVDLNTRHTYFGFILTYAFDLIATRIIQEQERFIGPMGLFYVDIETYDEDLFLKLRRKGKFQDIDIVQSDFKGYQLAFYYLAGRKGHFKKHNVYTLEKHNNMINERIESGEPMYNIKDFTINSIIPQVAEWAGLSFKETKRILLTGLMKMYHAIKRGCYVNLNSYKAQKVIFFIGRFYKDVEKQIKDYFFRSRMKFLRIWIWDKEKPDHDYFYIGIDRKLMASNFADLNDGKRLYTRVWTLFHWVFARRQLELILRHSTDIYIFKVKLHKKYRNRINVLVENGRFKDIEYIGRGINYVFHEEDRHWKELVKEFSSNEKGNS